MSNKLHTFFAAFTALYQMHLSLPAIFPEDAEHKNSTQNQSAAAHQALEEVENLPIGDFGVKHFSPSINVYLAGADVRVQLCFRVRATCV